MAVTRLGLEGYGVRRAGSFAGKAAASSHTVGILTRLALDGYGARRASSFAGKTPDTGPVTPPDTSQVVGGWITGGNFSRGRWRKFLEEIEAERRAKVLDDAEDAAEESRERDIAVAVIREQIEETASTARRKRLEGMLEASAQSLERFEQLWERDKKLRAAIRAALDEDEDDEDLLLLS
jgi:hypothetical protein